MDFRLTPPQEAFRCEVAAWADREFPGWDGRSVISTEQEQEAAVEVNRRLARKGWLGMAWPKEFGGGGASAWEQLVFNEELGYRRIPFGSIGVNIVGPTIMHHGTPEQMARFLRPILDGELNWCQGFSEPGSGSDLASLQTRAVRDGDRYIVNGQKIWTSRAHLSDWMVLLARTDPDAPKHRGISYFLLDMKSPGVTVRPIRDMTGAHYFNEVFFDDVAVPVECRVGEENRGWYVATTTLDYERSGAGRAAGLRRTVEDLASFLCQNDLLRPASRRKLADLAIAAQVGRMLSYQVASLQARGVVPNKEASMAKLYASELMQRVAVTGLELIGLRGGLVPGSKHAVLEGRYGDNVMSTLLITIGGGTSEIQRNIIATRGLGLPRG